jgi:hypothetical protein
MPEDPILPVDSSPEDEPERPDDSHHEEAAAISASADSPERTDAPEWTDDSGFEELAAPSLSAEDGSEPSHDDWEAAHLDWDDDYPEAADEPPAPTTTDEALAWLKPLLRQARSVWQRIIAGLRKRIPAAADLSDPIISAILIGILGVLLVLLNSVRQPSSAIAPAPPAPSPGAASEADTPSPPMAVPPAETTLPVTDTVETADAIDIERISQIQAQLTDSSIYNANRVIDSVQADFTHNRLTLICNEDWFRLSAYDQTQLANQLLSQSTGLSFQDLQLQTPEGQLIARNPIIGDAMIIYLREKPPVVAVPERPRYRITIDR